MNWKYVFNTRLNHCCWGTRDKCFEYVKKSGYEFFTWNGEIFFINLKDNEYIKTKLTINDLEKDK